MDMIRFRILQQVHLDNTVFVLFYSSQEKNLFRRYIEAVCGMLNTYLGKKIDTVQ